MKVYYNVDGTIQNVTGDSIFSQSDGSNELQMKIDYPETASLETKFLVPDGSGGVVAAEPIVMEVTPDYVDGGYMWQAPNGIGAGYLENAGKAYLSVRVLYENGTKVKTTRLVQFDIEPSGDYEATPITPEQADQILALIATANGNILELQESIKPLDTQKIYGLVYDSVVLNGSVYELYFTATVDNSITAEMIETYGLRLKMPETGTPIFSLRDVVVKYLIKVVKEDTTQIYHYAGVNFRAESGNTFVSNVTGQDQLFPLDEIDVFSKSGTLELNVTNKKIYNVASSTRSGLMSKEDKVLLGNKVDKNITSYPTATLSNLQEVYINDDGTEKKATMQQIKQYIVNDLINLNVRIKVAELPTENININAIYLVPLPTELTDNVYAEYYYDNLESKWELMGTTRVSLLAEDVIYNGSNVEDALNTIWNTIGDVETLLGGI